MIARPVSLATLLVLGLLGSAPRAAPALAPAPADTCLLRLECFDPGGQPFPVRARVQGSDGRFYPASKDLALLAHSGAGGYFYLDGGALLHVPAGTTRITVGRGFEWRAVDTTVTCTGRDTVRLQLARFTDLRPLGWACGDLHVHTQHPPIEYTITPEMTRRVARSEGLSVIHLLDQDANFTGAVSALSDAETILYFSYEVRNQTFGHAEFPGLRAPLDDECCLVPEPAWPMLLDVSRAVRASGEGALVLAHPHSTPDYGLVCCWPGAGLGRELPVLAALGGLDAMDVVSYSNAPDADWNDWYDVLSAGLRCPPSAGTDAVLNWYDHPPAGGWRVYAQLAPGSPLDYDAWLESFRQGRTFVTSYPLIPEFSVNGQSMGQSLECPDDTLEARIHFRAQCGIAIRRIALVADGADVWTREFWHWPPVFDKDTTLVVRIPTPGWLALRVEGPPGHPHTAGIPPVAHTNVVRLLRNGLPRRRPESLQRWLGELDQLEALVVARGGWSQAWEQDSVLSRIEQARQVYLGDAVPIVSSPHASPPAGPRAWPNPSRGAVRIEGFGDDAAIVDLAGRRVADRTSGLRREGGALVWDGRDHGLAAPPGLYWARSRDGRRATRLVILR